MPIITRTVGDPIRFVIPTLDILQSLTHPQIPFRGGHFLSEPIDNFDAPFFSISPIEASSMDPLHRLLLECGYHAFENGMHHSQHFYFNVCVSRV